MCCTTRRPRPELPLGGTVLPALVLALLSVSPTSAQSPTRPQGVVAPRAHFETPDDAALPARFRGLVLFDDGSYGTPEVARERGLTEFEGFWLDRRDARKIRVWRRALERTRGWEDACSYRTRHYRVRTDLPRHLVELEIEPFLDALYECYARVFREEFGQRGAGTNQKDIRIYRSYEEYALREPMADGSPRPRSNPAFIVDGSQLVTFWDETRPDDFFANVFHEGAHQFVKGLYPGADLPIWLDEGIATYFEACRWSRSRRQVEFTGRMPRRRLEEAQRVLSGTFEPGSGDPSLPRRLILDCPDDRFGATQYSLAATFVHYLLSQDSGSGDRSRLARFLDEANGAGAKRVEDIWREATHTRFEDASRGWRDYVLAMRPDADAQWCLLAVGDRNAAECGLRDGDRVMSVNGVQVYNAEHFDRVWARLDRDESIELVVARTVETDGPTVERRHLIGIPAGTPCDVRVGWVEGGPRDIAIID
ncbi:MAG: DUF1570 domain-containing protein [Planctomycetes bacterium]|nr:DUF1570 domain-containing protein [Planctomycetota bacterium]